MLKRFIFLFAVTDLLCTERGHASVPLEFNEYTRLAVRPSVSQDRHEQVIEMEEIRQPMNLLVPAIHRALTPQEQVFYNRDIVSNIVSYLEEKDTINLALVNPRLFKKLVSLSNSDSEAIDQLDEWCLVEKQHLSKRFRSLMTEAYSYLLRYKDQLPINLQHQFNRTIKSLLHESLIRHPYTLNISTQDRSALELFASLRSIPFPHLTLLQRATALYHGYRTDKITGFIRFYGTFLAITGGCIYIICQSNQYGGIPLAGNCYINILTNASINYQFDSDTFYSRYTIPRPKLNTRLLGQAALWTQLLFSGFAVASSFIYPHHAFSWQDYDLPEARRVDLRHDPLSDKREQNIDDFLDRVLCGENKHYVPSSHELIKSASEFYTYLKSPSLGRFAFLFGEDVALIFGHKNIQRTQLLTDLMSLYTWSPIFKLMGGKKLRDDLLQIAHIEDNHFSSTTLNKLRVALYGDYLLRYLPSLAFYYAIYQTFTSNFMGNLKEIPVLGLPTSDISYATYMTQ
jgi:hypothetical protein